MKNLLVTFTDDEMAAIEKLVEFYNMETTDPRWTPADWVHFIVADRLGMTRWKITTATNAAPVPTSSWGLRYD